MVVVCCNVCYGFQGINRIKGGSDIRAKVLLEEFYLFLF